MLIPRVRYWLSIGEVSFLTAVGYKLLFSAKSEFGTENAGRRGLPMPAVFLLCAGVRGEPGNRRIP